MLILFKKEELNSIYLDYIKQQSEYTKIYVVSRELYLYFRYKMKLNVDYVSLKDNHIYVCSGEINDNIDVYCEDLADALEIYGNNCNLYSFRQIHNVYNTIEI